MASQDPRKDDRQDPEPINPYQAPAVEIPPSVSDSPRVRSLRRRSGNDLIFASLFCSIFGFFIPFGFVLDLLSLFFLLRVLIARHRPTALWILLGVLVGLWNLLRVLILLRIVLGIVQQQLS